MKNEFVHFVGLFFLQPLHVSSRLTAHHQEVLLCMYSNGICHDENTVIPRLTSDPANEFFG